MSSSQRQLAENIATQFELSTLGFRHNDAVVFSDSSILKLFVPRSRRAFGGISQTRTIDGDMLFVPRDDLARLSPPSKRYEDPDTSFGCPLFNFPWLVGFQLKDGQLLDPRFQESLLAVFGSLPNDLEGWQGQFGDDFPTLRSMDKLSVIVRFLREKRPDDLSR